MSKTIPLLIGLVICLRPAVALAQTTQMTLEIVNNSGKLDSEVFAYLQGSGSSTFASTALDSLTPGSGAHTYTYPVSAISNGRLYISYGSSLPGSPSPTTSTTRYDFIELTFPGGSADLSSVDQFGIPLQIETFDTNGRLMQKLTYYASRNTLVNDLLGIVSSNSSESIYPGNAIITTDGMTLAPNWSNFARILGPNQTVTPGYTNPDPSKGPPYPDLTNYVTAAEGTTFTISGVYQGNVDPNPTTFNYTGTYNAGMNAFVFNGTAATTKYPANSQLVIPVSGLPDAIYSVDGTYTVGGAAAQVSDNDVYAAMYRDFVSGFDFGYVGGKYGNNSSVWYSNAPFNPPFAAARSAADNLFNQYGAIIYDNSDSYGFPFGDLLGSGQAVLASLSDAATLRVTILPDDMLDSPAIKTVSASSGKITLTWGAVAHATGYELTISPPLPAQVATTSSLTHTFTGLQAGTPYTITVSATDNAEKSNAIPIVVSTPGTAPSVTGSVDWSLTLYFPAYTPAGQTITVNGISQDIPGNIAIPAVAFTGPVTGLSGNVGTNAYIVEWKSGDVVIFQSILYATISAGGGALDATNTFLDRNAVLPVITGLQVALSVQPNISHTTFYNEKSMAAPQPSDGPASDPGAEFSRKAGEIGASLERVLKIPGHSPQKRVTIALLRLRNSALKARAEFPDDEPLRSLHRQAVRMGRSSNFAQRRRLREQIQARLQELRAAESGG